jgi:hypothetical protein
VNGGLVNASMVNGGRVNASRVNGGLVNGGLVNGGLVNAGLVNSGNHRHYDKMMDSGLLPHYRDADMDSGNNLHRWLCAWNNWNVLTFYKLVGCSNNNL